MVLRLMKEGLGPRDLANRKCICGWCLQLETQVGYHKRKPWSKFINDNNRHLVTPEAIDFLDGLLKFDHQVRGSKAAAAHSVRVQGDVWGVYISRRQGGFCLILETS